MLSTWANTCSSAKWRMVMASKGHSAAQVPQPAHAASMKLGSRCAFLSAASMALNGQTLAHTLHSWQLSEIKFAVIASILTSPACSRFPARAAATRATLWTGAWPKVHGGAGDGAPRPAGTVLETTPGLQSGALGAEPLWVTAARDGVETVVVDVPQATPFGPFLDEKHFGAEPDVVLRPNDTVVVGERFF